MAKKFELQIDEVETYISEKMEQKLNKGIIAAVMSYLHRISCYREEDKTFSFKIALGYDQVSQMEAPCFFPIKQFPLATDEENKKNVKKAIHDVAVFCEKGSDLYIYQKNDASGTSIICGTYFTELAKTGYLDELIIANKGMVIESANIHSVILKTKCEYGGIESAWINFSLLKLDILSGSGSRQSDECRYWDGIFRAVRKNVHGTICLIVKPEWDPSSDESFTKQPEILSKIDISYDPKQSDQKKNSIDIFLSMLDYDGITILGTDGLVKSYHNFCKNKDDDDALLGGARHRAYEFLKERCNPAYVGIYFQSHEGNVEYYDFTEELERNRKKACFDSKVMSYGTDNDFARDVLAFLEQNVGLSNQRQLNFFNNATQTETTFYDHINKLKVAHEGINNFTKEEEPAKNLFEFYCTNKKSIDVSLGKYPFLERAFINVLVLCYVGNDYGYSYTARPYVEKIMKAIPHEVYVDYFRNKYYITYEILRALENQESEWHDAASVIAGTAPGKSEHLDFLGEIGNLSSDSYDLKRALNHFRRERPELDVDN